MKVECVVIQYTYVHHIHSSWTFGAMLLRYNFFPDAKLYALCIYKLYTIYINYILYIFLCLANPGGGLVPSVRLFRVIRIILLILPTVTHTPPHHQPTHVTHTTTPPTNTCYTSHKHMLYTNACYTSQHTNTCYTPNQHMLHTTPHVTHHTNACYTPH